VERIFKLLYSTKERDGTLEINDFKKSIQFRNLYFSYPNTDRMVLNDINLEILSGEIVAIVGVSGVGKSTLVDLIPRFYNPTAGHILLDGVDLEDIQLQSLRSLIAIVSQDVVLFNDTVRENISFGRSDVSLEDITHAAKQAYAHEFVEKMSDGYDTVIGERRITLSGGQRQRIAIARAILKNPPILILDEATSSLDSVSESLVQKALETLMLNRTTIIIAHRLSTILNADRLIVLDEGRIIDTGKHEELMTRCHVYRKLYETFSLVENY
jgi:subfamily B ATP-binding cassette protein MsbA